MDETHGLKRAVEVFLWRVVNVPKIPAYLKAMLDAWKAFVDKGGIRRADYQVLKEDQIPFASATLRVSLWPLLRSRSLRHMEAWP